MFIRHSYTQNANSVTLAWFYNNVEKDIKKYQSRGIYISALENCRKIKFRTYLHLTLSKFVYVVTVE